MALFSIAQIVQRASISSAYKLAEVINLSAQMIYTYIAIVLAFFDDFRILNNSKEYYSAQNFNEKYFLINCINLSQANYRFDFLNFIIGYFSCKNFEIMYPHRLPYLYQKCHQHNN